MARRTRGRDQKHEADQWNELKRFSFRTAGSRHGSCLFPIEPAYTKNPCKVLVNRTTSAPIPQAASTSTTRTTRARSASTSYEIPPSSYPNKTAYYSLERVWQGLGLALEGLNLLLLTPYRTSPALPTPACDRRRKATDRRAICRQQRNTRRSFSSWSNKPDTNCFRHS